MKDKKKSKKLRMTKLDEIQNKWGGTLPKNKKWALRNAVEDIDWLTQKVRDLEKEIQSFKNEIGPLEVDE